MKYVKKLSFAGIAIAALMGFLGVGTASATQLTCPGGAVCPVGTTIHAESEGHTIFHPPFGEITCSGSTLEAALTSSGSATTTVQASVSNINFTGCNATVHVINKGTLEFHTQNASANNNGTLTSSDFTVTIVFGGFHCIYGTKNTDIGLVTGSATTGGNATVDIAGILLRHGGGAGVFCGNSAPWTGAYKITKPNPLNVH